MSHETPPAAPQDLAALLRLEEELEAEWSRLQAEGHGAAGVRARLEEKGADEEERGRALAEADAAQRTFLERLDVYQQTLHAHFLAKVEAELAHAVETMARFYGPRRVGRVRRAHGRLVRLAERYRELEPLYGTDQDHRRIAVYQRFYAGAVDFAERIRRLDPTAPRPRPKMEGCTLPS